MKSTQVMPGGAAVGKDLVALDAQPGNDSVFNDWYQEKHYIICFNVQLKCFVGSCGQSKRPSRAGSTEQLNVMRWALDQISFKSLFIHRLIQPVQKSAYCQVLPNTQITCGDVATAARVDARWCCPGNGSECVARAA